MTSCQTAAWFDLYRIINPHVSQDDLLAWLHVADHRLYVTGSYFYLAGLSSEPVLVGYRPNKSRLWWRQCDLFVQPLRDCAEISCLSYSALFQLQTST